MIPQRETMSHFVTAGLTMLAPVSALAQQPPAATTTAARTAPRWRFQVSADGSWYENARFVGADDAATWSAGGRASLTFSEALRRGSLSLGAYAGSIYYPEIDSFNQPRYGGNLGLSWAPSRRTQFSFAQTYDRSNTRQLESLDPEALPVPTSGLATARTSLSLTQGLSQRWQFGLGGGYMWRRYDNDALVGGEQVNGSAQLSRRLGKSSSAYLGYGYSSSWLEDRTSRAHQLLLGAEKHLEHVGWQVGGGMAYLESVGQFYPAGRAGFTAHGRRTSLSLAYSRDFGMAFGYGRQMIADLASATLGYTPARRFSLTAGYYFGYRRDPAEIDYTIRSHVASTGFNWGITSRWWRRLWISGTVQMAPSTRSARTMGISTFFVTTQ